MTHAVVFVDNSDPYAEDLEASLLTSESAAPHGDEEWNHNDYRAEPMDVDVHGLAALSAAATQNHRYSFHHPPSPLDRADAASDNDDASFMHPELPTSAGPIHSPTEMRSAMPHPTSPSASITAANSNINFLLNPSNSTSPSIDPGISPSGARRRESSYTSLSAASRTAGAVDLRAEEKVETDHEIAFLLRHFAEVVGYWYVVSNVRDVNWRSDFYRMDLFDLETYFVSYVPVKALSNPLLKYAACAYAAKQLGRVKGTKAIVGGVCSKQASMEVWPDAEKVDWYWYGAKYYEKAIQLLMKELRHDAEGPTPLSTAEAFGQWQAAEVIESHARNRRRRFSNSRLSSAHSDEVLAATAILSVYEFLDATGPAWNRHLSGFKSLLDIAEVGILPLEQQSSPGGTVLSLPRPGLTKSRRATFWNFARQDYLSACA
jgi:hypothetical protein